MISFKVQKLSPEATLPSKENPADAGIDVYTNESYTLKPGERHLFSTGISVEFPKGYVALLWDRSGLGSKGIHRLAGVNGKWFCSTRRTKNTKLNEATKSFSALCRNSRQLKSLK